MHKVTVLDYAKYPRDMHYLIDRYLAGEKLTAEQEKELWESWFRGSLREELDVMREKLLEYMKFHQIPEGEPSGPNSQKPTDEFQLVQDYDFALRLIEKDDWKRLSGHLYRVGQRLNTWLNRTLLEAGEGVYKGIWEQQMVWHKVQQDARSITEEKLEKEDSKQGKVTSKPGQYAPDIQKVFAADPAAYGLKKAPTVAKITEWIKDLFPEEARKRGRPKKQ